MRTKIVSSLYTLIGLPLTASVASLLLRGFPLGATCISMKTKKTYSEQLKDPRWQKKRLEILQRDEFTCQSCGDTEATLHVHHLAYFNDKECWDIENEFLVTLCYDCHESNTLSFNKAKQYLQSYTYDSDAIGYIHDLLIILKNSTPDILRDVCNYAIQRRK